MSRRGEDCYFGTDVWTGAVRMIVPNLFAAEGYCNYNGKFQVRTITDMGVLEEMSKMIIQNNISFRGAVTFESIHKDYVSKKTVRKIKKYLDRGQIEKAGDKVWGYCLTCLRDYIDDNLYFLGEIGELNLNNFERKESRPIVGVCYEVGDKYVINLPDNFLVTLHPDGKLDIDTRPSILKERAKKEMQDISKNPTAKIFTVNREVIGELEKACFEKDSQKKEALVKEITRQIRYSWKRKNKNGN
ncbi:MAG: hypothetical protein KKF50_00855 [Nanoarchaeota archaeon]|nr:hypothetical protein [Nanoarchaeota archaeon]